MALVLVPQLYVIARPTSARYCRQPLLNSLTASISLSLIASGFSVVLTLIEVVPQGLWASCHAFGLLSFGHGVCCVILTFTAAECAKTTPELYHMSLFITVASILSTEFLFCLWYVLCRGGHFAYTPHDVFPQICVRCAGSQRPIVADKKAATMSYKSSPAVSHGHRIVLAFHAVSVPPARR
ncbi:uncharacterized protein ACBT44_015922 isoform 1-T1 [Syngnathus typhle]